MSDQFPFAIEAKVTGRSAAGDNQRLSVAPVTVHFDSTVRAHMFEIFHGAVFKSSSELLGLLVHTQDKIGSVHPFRKSGIIFHGGRCGELPAGLSTFKDQGRKVGASGINRAR